MIISQVIRSGLCVVSKTGSYFQLISASGIVNVILKLKGRTVLDSKMWVGMNLDKAMPYNEIIITAEQDGPIEFWAGDVSMQLFTFNNAVAKAVTTSRKFVYGKSQITDPNYLRRELRIRASKTVGLGGAAMNGDGWLANAGEIVTLPIAGTVFAETERAEIGLANGTVAEDQNVYPNAIDVGALNLTYGDLMVNYANKQQRVLVSDQAVLFCDGVTWSEHPDFIGSTGSPTYFTRHGIQSPTGTMFIVERHITTNQIKLYQSEDGAEFKIKKIISESEQKTSAGITTTGFSSTYQPVLIDTKITVCYYSHYLIWDYQKNSWRCIRSEANNGQILIAIADDVWLRTHESSAGIYQLQKTEDAGINWRTVYNAEGTYNGSFIYNSLRPSFDGKNLLIKGNSLNHPIFSQDYGETWKDSGFNIAYSDAVYITGNLNVWLLEQSGAVYYLDITNPDLPLSAVEVNFPNQMNPLGFVIDDTGQIYTLMDGYSYSYQMAVAGDISPAVVEVMELLA